MNVKINPIKSLILRNIFQSSLNYICDYYLNIADLLLNLAEGVVPRELKDRELFNLLSNFYLSDNSLKPQSVSLIGVPPSEAGGAEGVQGNKKNEHVLWV